MSLFVCFQVVKEIAEAIVWLSNVASHMLYSAVTVYCDRHCFNQKYLKLGIQFTNHTESFFLKAFPAICLVSSRKHRCAELFKEMDLLRNKFVYLYLECKASQDASIPSCRLVEYSFVVFTSYLSFMTLLFLKVFLPIMQQAQRDIEIALDISK